MNLQGFYLWRGETTFRQVRSEAALAKFLYARFSIITVDLSRYDLLQQYRLLMNADFLLYASGSAGLATVHCNQACHVIEISPKTVFLSDLYRHDLLARGGPYTIYICDLQSKECSETGDPRWIDVNRDRLSKLILSL